MEFEATIVWTECAHHVNTAVVRQCPKSLAGWQQNLPTCCIYAVVFRWIRFDQSISSSTKTRTQNRRDDHGEPEKKEDKYSTSTFIYLCNLLLLLENENAYCRIDLLKSPHPTHSKNVTQRMKRSKVALLEQ